ncbi:hypothetical protein GCM10023156_51210 [Novipirellula rosea]|uniref:Uncharacterized protein n=1 Tax=Novipirellula rosea TaxID=1031540 RepID=A0ABP8NF94_9BACT
MLGLLLLGPLLLGPLLLGPLLLGPLPLVSISTDLPAGWAGSGLGGKRRGGTEQANWRPKQMVGQVGPGAH